ncbi:pentatricopeptide repeat-containing protein At3g04760, chloroplastic-like [Punica granatum]|uniref:Pentatricopeptide repeat-containing protein At3g04760, chloroplastic-like n=1 Tax=Punica granatum TaxID=22663 RepID=A0A6P8DFC3_PUNGR|nr:pentatricopeptide repeat-containing protein At3g04760, chloroplastic-like [Punica granatum]
MISHGRRTKLFHLLQWRQLHSGPSTSDFKDTHQIKLLNRSCKARKYSEYLYFLERLVSKLNYKPEVVLCTKLIKGFFGLGKLEKTLRVMEILEKYATAQAAVIRTREEVKHRVLLDKLCPQGHFSVICWKSSHMNLTCWDGYSILKIVKF